MYISFGASNQAPDSEPSLTPVFLSSTCFDRLELDNNNRASWILHPGPSESDVYSDVVQEAQWNDLLHTARLLIRLDTPLHGNNARGAKYAVYYASVATHPVFENIKMAALRAMSEEKSCSPFPCFFIPCSNRTTQYNRLDVSCSHLKVSPKVNQYDIQRVCMTQYKPICVWLMPTSWFPLYTAWYGE